MLTMILFLVLFVPLLLLACFLIFHCYEQVIGYRSYPSDLEECSSAYVPNRSEIHAGFVGNFKRILNNNIILPLNYFCNFKRSYAESSQTTGQIVTGHENERMDLEYEIKSTKATNGCKHAVFVI